MASEANKRPLYQKIIDNLLERIQKGQLQAGDRVPSQNELANLFGVSTITSRRALEVLAEQGVIRRIQGKGSFVETRPKKTISKGHVAFVLQHTITDNQQLFNPLFHAILTGLTDAASINGYHVSFHTADRDDHLESTGVFDAWVIAGLPSRPGIEALQKQGKPVVTLTSYFPDLGVPIVTSDHFAGGFLATSHLIEQGHQDIAVVSPLHGPDDEFGGRYAGFRAAMGQYGLPINDDYVVHSPHTAEGAGYQKASKLLKNHRPSAIVATTDMIALGVLRAAKQLGLEIPEDLSLVGYDDQLFARHVMPPLTTIKQDGYEIGKRTFDLINKMLTGDVPLQLRNEIPPKLIVRESTRKVTSST